MKYKSYNILIALMVFVSIAILTVPNKALAIDVCFWCEKTLSDYKEILKDENLNLGEKNNEVSEEYHAGIKTLFTFTSILKKSKNENEAFGAVHDSWEDIENAVKGLNSDFKNLVKSADDLFRFAEEKANSISDSELKNMSLRKINRSKNAYTENLIKTRKNLAKLDVLNTRVKDKITALEISYTLDTLDDVLSTAFSGLENNVSEIISEIKSLEKETNTLLGQL